MSESHQLIVNGLDLGDASPREASLIVDAHRPRLLICDGYGGALTLDCSAADMGALADACERLMDGPLPPGASLLKVRAGSQVYLISRRHGADDGAIIALANLFDPGEHVRLAESAARTTAEMIRLALSSGV